MPTKHMLDWFLTEGGKRFSYNLAGTVITGSILGHFLPNSVLINYYKDCIRLYSNGFSVPVPDKIHSRFQKVLDILEVPLIEKPDYKPFMVAGFDVISAGSSYSKFGVIVGLPSNFTYDSVDSISDKSKIKVNQESVLWESDEGKQLLNALVLSENAQMYVMAREIKFRQSYKPLYDVIFTVVGCGSTYFVSNFLNQHFNLYSKPRQIRLIMYSIVCLFTWGNYVMGKDLTQLQYEAKIDKELKAKSSIFAEGGKEFYSKIIERNIALRKLLGREGESMFTVLGNENYLFRNKHTPLVHRRAFFEKTEDATLEPSVEPA